MTCPFISECFSLDFNRIDDRCCNNYESCRDYKNCRLVVLMLEPETDYRPD